VHDISAKSKSYATKYPRSLFDYAIEYKVVRTYGWGFKKGGITRRELNHHQKKVYLRPHHQPQAMHCWKDGRPQPLNGTKEKPVSSKQGWPNKIKHRFAFL
jgi:hypothetical protein